MSSRSSVAEIFDDYLFQDKSITLPFLTPRELANFKSALCTYRTRQLGRHASLGYAVTPEEQESSGCIFEEVSRSSPLDEMVKGGWPREYRISLGKRKVPKTYIILHVEDNPHLKDMKPEDL